MTRISAASRIGRFLLDGMLAALVLLGGRAFGGEPSKTLKVEGIFPEPVTRRLTSDSTDDDFPACAVGRDGAVWLVYVAYHHGPPVDVDRVHKERDFTFLVPRTNGDQVRLMCLREGLWRGPWQVTSRGLDVWRPQVAVDGQGTVWIVWSERKKANWDLYARSFDPETGKFGAVLRLTEDPGSDLSPQVTVNPVTGDVYVAWRGWRKDNFEILAARLEGGRLRGVRNLTQTKGNEWSPVAVFDPSGVLHVAFDSYDRGDYDVGVASLGPDGRVKVRWIARSDKFEARPSIAVGPKGRVYVAFERGDANWGKDWGMRWPGRRGSQLYRHRAVIARCLLPEGVKQVEGVVPCERVRRLFPSERSRRASHPRIAFDRSGRLWLTYRRHASREGQGELWKSFVLYHTGRGWSPAVVLPRSANLLDNRPALAALPSGGLLIIHSSDGRKRGIEDAGTNDLYVSIFPDLGPGPAPMLVDPPGVQPVTPVHPNEPAEIARLRSYRATIGGRTYRILRGEFHRHTELTSHRDQDGTLEDMWRYAVDAAALDWVGNGDHDNGEGIEYLWWLVQKETDMYHHPPSFIPVFSYERSVPYPSGHRNAVFARRGIRPLPRIRGGRDLLYGTPEKGSPDVHTFYAYLRYFGGICASHTSGTRMGTDWRDNDPEVEPVVEIYQGLRQSYEHIGGPATAKGPKDSMGGWRPAGFVWKALMKGYRLGFESSSDHYSSHISYTMVWVEEPTREGILQALKARHCYGANDNILLDVRCGDHMMGDSFALSGNPTLSISVVGTRPIAQIAIIRGVGKDKPRYMYTVEPGKREVSLTWTDREPVRGKVNYYYVRIEQERPPKGFGALAWASPMWIRINP